MKDFTIFRTGSQRGVNTFMLGEGAIEHPLSTRSASDGTSWKARGWRYIASILMFLMLSVGNAWAIDWTNYAEGHGPQNGGKYYLYDCNTKYKTDNTTPDYTLSCFLKTPTTAYTNVVSSGAGSGQVTAANWRKEFVTTNHAEAVLFTFEQTGESTNKFYIKYKESPSDEAYKYVTNQWGKSKVPTSTWNTTHTEWIYNTSGTYEGALMYHNINDSALFMQNTTTILTQGKVTSTFGTRVMYPWKFISEDAYADATGTQYYYTVETQIYTNGASSPAGGTLGVVRPTYAKPDLSDWSAGDYASSIAKNQKGATAGYPIVTIFAKVTPTDESYEFTGFTDGSGNALTESETIAAGNYYKVDNANNIYRVSFTANGSDASPTAFTLRACYSQTSEPTVNVYHNEAATGYPTFAAALDAAVAGDRIELLADVENVSSTITLSKNITLDFNGHKIKSAATGAPTNLIEVTGNVTFTENSIGTPGGVTTTGATAVLVSGGSLTINDGKYEGATYAVNRTGGTVTIKNGGFEGNTQDINGTITLNGGFFAHSAGLEAPVGYAVVSDIPTGMKYGKPTYNYMTVSKNSHNYPLCVLISEEENKETIYLNFNTLEGALAYANNNVDDNRVKTIMMRENYTLPAGNYTIPMYTTLVIPYSKEQTAAMPFIRRESSNDVPNSAYRTLTLANGVHIDVRGAIEVGGVQTTGSIDAAGEHGISRPGGATYGLMQMNSGSSITFYEDANLYAWGFIVGEGTIDMRRGAVAREQFQMYDWKGFMPTANMAVGGSVDYTYHVLPINQYFIQNVEVETTYRPGAKLYGQVSAYVMSMSIGFNDIGIIGVKYSDAEKTADPDLEDDVAIFLMDNEDDSEDTWVRKSYDVDHDVQLYEVNNSAYLGSLVMKIDLAANNIYIPWEGSTIVDLDVDSRDFALPITNNFKIHLLSGTLVVTQDTELLPGSVIEVNKHSTLTIEDHVWKKIKNVNTWVESPQTLYLYDKDQWGTYVFTDKESDYNFGYASRILCRPGGVPEVRNISSPEGLGDAKLIVHGNVDVKGYLKTTHGDKTASPVISETLVPNTNPARYIYKVTTSIQTATPETLKQGGASIISTTTDAGTIKLLRNPGSNASAYVSNYIWQIGSIGNVNKDEPDYYGDHVVPAWLKNADGSYTDTKNQPAGQSYCFIDFNGVGTWKNLTTDGCFVYDENSIYYAKPREYVALANGKTENADHTYSSADGTKTLILMDDCQWWEVEPVENRPDLFHCTHPQNDMYYYWDGEKWTEKRYTVTWNDWDGTVFDKYSMKYGVQPKYLGNVPQREKDDYYTYDFVGWSPEITESTIVAGDVTYTAQYARKDVMYTITWKDEANNVIEVGYFKLGDVPTCSEAPNMTNKEWKPAVSAVTGNTEYKLQTKEDKDNYTITWKNWDGTTLQTTTPPANTSAADVLAGYTADPPTKPALGDIVFSFAGWTPTVLAATADAVYTAKFTEQAITYTILWKNDNGAVLETDNNVTLNTVPQYNGSTPVRSSDGENYVFAGWTPTVEAATDNAEYTATYEAKSKIVDGVTYAVPASTTVTLTNLIITDDGKVSVPDGSQLNANSLTLESTGTASGELIVANNSLIYAANAYFDYKVNAKNHKWYGVAVPWQVDAQTGISVNGKTLVLGKDFDIVYYNGAQRAEVGKQKCWSYVEDDGDKTLQPGRLYMIGLMMDAPQGIRFAKKAGASILTTTTSVTAYSGAAASDDQGWNGVANPALFHAFVNPGVTAGQVYNPETNSYDPILMSDAKFVVGQGAFVEVSSNKDITVTYGGVYAAPRRARAEEAPLYDVRIAPAEAEYTDRLFVRVEDEKEADKYVIGKDLAKLGVSKSVAQMWINRYNTELCLNTMTMENAEYPLSIFAPKAGEYTISSQYSVFSDQYTLYLTFNDEAIWNLSDGAYTGTFEKGTTSEYGLRVSARAPQIATGIDEAVVDAKGETRKVLIDNQVFIIRGENVYSVDGQLVK